MTITRAFKVRLYPTKSQEQKLIAQCGAVRFVWNYYLEKRRREYIENNNKLTYVDCAKDLTQLRKKTEYQWLGDVLVNPLQQSLRDLDTALRNYFKKNAQYPKFKSRHSNRNAFRFPNRWKVEGNKICISTDFTMRFRGRVLEGELKSVTVYQDVDGKWYASIVCQQDVDYEPKTGDPIGIDLGLTHLAITSDGKKYDTYRPKKILKKRMKKLQQDLARKQKGSINRIGAKHNLAVLHKKIRNQRLDYLHQVSHRITSENQALIVCEDLAVKNMVKNHKLADAISESSWAEFVRQLEYKQLWRGGRFVKVDRFFPSSKTCSNCGFIINKLPLSVRQWICPSCKTAHDRDVNAARMILAQGLSNSLCVESTESTPLIG